MPTLKTNSAIVKRLTVDPGISGTGIATWLARDWEKCVPPVAVTNIYAREGEWEDRVPVICERFEWNLKLAGDVDLVCIELPKFFSGVRGNATAVSGDLIKLTYLAGCYAEIARKHGAAVRLFGAGD